MKSYFIPGDGDEDRRYEVETLDDGTYRVITPEGEELRVDAYSPEPGRLHLLLGDGRAVDAGVRERDGVFTVEVGDERHHVDVLNERQRRMLAAGVGGSRAAGPELHSPMAGKVVAVDVAAGDVVEEGQRVLIVEAMKMENDLKAHASGTIASVEVAVGQAVEVGDVLIVIEIDA